VQQAVDARGRIPECEAGVTALEMAQAALAAAQSTVDERRAASQAAGEQLQAVRLRIQTDHRTTRDTLLRLAAAQQRVTELEDEIQALEREAETDRQRAHHDQATRLASRGRDRERYQQALVAAGDTATQETADLEARSRTQRETLDAIIRQRETELADLDAQIASLAALRDETAPAKAELDQAEAELHQARLDATAASQALTRLEAEITAFERRRSEFRTRQAERMRLETAVAALQTHLVEWQALARILGREGLPVLEIDAAGPGVSALANDLLQSCFGSRFTVELITQDAKADGKGFKEVFELRVWDSERGGEAKDLALCSGGEKVIIEEGIKLAVALFINQRNELPLRTLIRDETTGALFPETALQYVQMLRMASLRGGFSRAIFITHSPDAAALADAQVVMKNGTLTICHPPFVEAA
jgi:exonuclease SbcC